MVVSACAADTVASPSTTPSLAPATQGPTDAPAATTASVGSIPSGSPLTLVWQTGSNPGSQMQDPIHLALGPEGNIYVGTATPSGLIRVFDPNGNFVTAWGSKGSSDGEFDFLLGIGVDAQGNVYAADFNRTRVNKFDSSGTYLLAWATEQPIGPAGVAVDAQGNVYVVNHRAHEHQVQKFDGKGKLLAGWGSNGSGEGQIGAGAKGGPEDLAVDQQGNV